MIKPDIPKNEAERLAVLDSYRILDSVPQEEFDALAKIASIICKTPIGLISLVDEKRQWFKAHIGISETETAREIAFCAHAINTPSELLIVNDTNLDKRFVDNPLTQTDPNVRFYAGAPLVSPEGFALGTICVIDNIPRQLDNEQQEALKALSVQVMAQLELRRRLMAEEMLNTKVQQINDQLRRYAYIVSHDIRSPLRGLSQLTEILLDDHGKNLSQEVKASLEMIHKRAIIVNNLVNGILEHSVSIEKEADTMRIKLHELIEDLYNSVDGINDINLIVDVTSEEIESDRTILMQVLQNLLSNAIKYNDKDNPEVIIRMKRDEKLLDISVQDNGPGIPADQQERVFQIFQTLGRIDRFGNKGSGIGLSTVKEMVEKINGKISLISEPGKGCLFNISIPL